MHVLELVSSLLNAPHLTSPWLVCFWWYWSCLFFRFIVGLDKALAGFGFPQQTHSPLVDKNHSPHKLKPIRVHERCYQSCVEKCSKHGRLVLSCLIGVCDPVATVSWNVPLSMKSVVHAAGSEMQCTMVILGGDL